MFSDAEAEVIARRPDGMQSRGIDAVGDGVLR
jgi:hypothetical protein